MKWKSFFTMLLVMAYIFGPLTVSAESTPLPAQRLQTPYSLESWYANGCIYTKLDATIVTASHCKASRQEIRDIAWEGPTIEWAPPPPPGSIVTGIEYPTQLEAIGYGKLGLFWVKGQGTQRCPSGMLGWHESTRPFGVMSRYSTDPKVTGLPQGWFVCGFETP